MSATVNVAGDTSVGGGGCPVHRSGSAPSSGSRGKGGGGCPALSGSSAPRSQSISSVVGGCTSLSDAERSLTDAIVEAAFDAMFLSNEAGIVQYVNETAVAATGFQKHELIGQNVSALIGDPHHAAAHDHYMKRYLRTGESKIIGKTREGQKLLAKRKDGSVFPAELGLAEIRSTDGRVRQFVGFARDISQRKRDEVELRRRQALSDAIIEACVDPMFVVEEDGTIQTVNSAAAEQFLFERDELLGRNISSIIDGDNVSGSAGTNGGRGDIIGRCLAAGGSSKKLEFRARRKDGSLFQAQIGFRKVELAAEEESPWHKIGADDRPLFCGSVHDLTEHKRVLQLEVEQTKAEALLFNMLPEEIADRLKGNPNHIADHHACVAILFADIVGFTAMSSAMSPVTLVGMLNELFSSFDDLVERYDLNKVKTIGDCYMVTSRPDIEGQDRQRIECSQMCNFGMDMLAVLAEFNGHHPDCPLDLRVGINTGPVVAGVVGTKRFLYDIWGDAVNIASRMESTGVPGKIQVTKDVVDFIGTEFVFERRGMVHCKGKGEIETYFLDRRKDEGRVRKVVGKRRSSQMLPDDSELLEELGLWPKSASKDKTPVEASPPQHDPMKSDLRMSLTRMQSAKEFLENKIEQVKHRLSYTDLSEEFDDGEDYWNMSEPANKADIAKAAKNSNGGDKDRDLGSSSFFEEDGGAWDVLAPLHVTKLVDHSADEFECRIPAPTGCHTHRTLTVSQDREARRRPAYADGDVSAPPHRNGDGADLTENHSLTGAVVWDGAVVLAGILACASSSFAADAAYIDPRGKRVVELGCGRAALPGIAAAAMGASSVALTDLDVVVGSEGLRSNIERNLHPRERSRVFVTAHRWGSPVLPPCTEGADLVLAADVVYDVGLVGPLVSSLTALLRAGRPGARAVVTYDASVGRREAYRKFEEEMYEKFDLVERLGEDVRDNDLDSNTVMAFLVSDPLPLA